MQKTKLTETKAWFRGLVAI